MEKVYFGKSVEITSGTDLIDNDMSNMFKNNSQIEYVYNIPYSVKTMENTFLNCTNLINVGKLPSRLESANSTFKGCSIFNQSLENLGFIDLKNLKFCKYIFSDNIKRDDDIVSFPESVENASYSFQTTAIKKIEFDITKNYNLTDLTYAFSNCLNLKSCNLIPSTVAVLNYCFYNSGINSLPKFSLSTICQMQHTFEQTKLTIINRDLPQSILMDYCFANIPTLTDVDGKYFHLVKNYSSTDNLFYNCINLTTISGTLENMGNCDSAFQGCSKLKGSLSLTGVISCQDFINSNINITNLSIKGRIVPCGPTILDNKKLGDFLNMSETDKENDDSHKKIGNFIQLLKNLNGGKNVEVHISDADIPVDAMILQEMDDIVLTENTKYRLYLSSFDLNDYEYKIENDNIRLIKTIDSFKDKRNITLPSHYWLNNKLYKIVPSSNLFEKKVLTRVISSLSQLSNTMFSDIDNLQEFIFLKTGSTQKIIYIPDYCFVGCSQVQFFNLENLPLTQIGARAFYNAINQNIQFNLSNSILVYNEAFYNKNKNNKYEILLNFMKSNKSDPYQIVRFRSPKIDDYEDDVSKNFVDNLKDNFINKLKLDLDNNLEILIKINNFNDFKEHLYNSGSSSYYFISKKNSSTIIYNKDKSHTKSDFENCDKIYIGDTNGWNNGYTKLYWTVFKGVD